MKEIRFDNGNEFFIHRDRNDGSSDLFYGTKGYQNHNHVVFDQNRNVDFLREDGFIKADDNFQQ